MLEKHDQTGEALLKIADTLGLLLDAQNRMLAKMP